MSTALAPATSEGSVDEQLQRVDALHERSRVESCRRSVPLAEGVATSEGATLVLSGEVNLRSMPQLEHVVASIVAFRPQSLVVDLSQSSSVSLDALVAIVRRLRRLERAEVRLPRAVSSSIGRLLAR